jgi:hypothetical protein
MPAFSAISLGGVTASASAVVNPEALSLLAVAGPTPGRVFRSLSSAIIISPFIKLELQLDVWVWSSRLVILSYMAQRMIPKGGEIGESNPACLALKPLSEFVLK